MDVQRRRRAAADGPSRWLATLSCRGANRAAPAEVQVLCLPRLDALIRGGRWAAQGAAAGDPFSSLLRHRLERRSQKTAAALCGVG